MRIPSLCCLFCFCIWHSEQAWAQMDLYPSHFGQVQAYKNVLNPALSNSIRATNLLFCNQFYTGAFGKINNLFFLGNLCLNGQDSARNSNSIGVKFVNEQEGDYITRSKYYVSYSFRTRIVGDYWLGMGLNLGRAGYRFDGTNVSSLGSDSDWDGDVGMVFESATFHLAASANQLFNTVILPKDLAFRWTRFYTVYGDKQVRLTDNSYLYLYVQHQFLPTATDLTDLGLQLILAEHVLFGGNVYLDKKASFVAGLRNISFERHHFSLMASYNMPIGSSTGANIQSFELSLAYFLH